MSDWTSSNQPPAPGPKGSSIYDVHTVKGGRSGSGGRKPYVDVHTENKNLSPLTSSCLLLMQRSWCIFYQNFVFGRNKLLIVQLNKLQSYSRISALGLEGHCTSRFKRAVCISCRPRVDVHMGEGVRPMWTHVDRGRGSKRDFVWTS